MAALFRTAGFEAIAEDELCRTVVKSGGEPFWTQLLTRDYGKHIDALSETRQAEVHDGMAAAFGKYQEGGEYRLLTAQRYIVGTVS